jgi:hypothetical protein
MKSKSQTGMEFLIIAGTVLFFFTLFFVAIHTTTEERNEERENLVIKNLALSIQDEINLATEASDGYVRTFKVPELILGKNYDVEIVDNHINIKTNRNALSLRINDVIGQIQKGENIIKKQNGTVYLNQ